jgi:hypothetical protein
MRDDGGSNCGPSQGEIFAEHYLAGAVWFRLGVHPYTLPEHRGGVALEWWSRGGLNP